MIPREQRIKGGLKDRIVHISMGLDRYRDLVDNIRNSLDLCDNEGCDILDDL